MRGFTLVELLISITIIAILASIALISYSSVTKGARDGHRQTDLNFIQSALEQYFADNRYYPYSNSVVSGQAFTNATGAISGTVSSRTYLTKTPSDPLSSGAYLYKAYKDSGATQECLASDAGLCVTYCLFANMENVPPVADAVCASFPTGGYDFGITRP